MEEGREEEGGREGMEERKEEEGGREWREGRGSSYRVCMQSDDYHSIWSFPSTSPTQSHGKTRPIVYPKLTLASSIALIQTSISSLVLACTG